MRCIFTIKTNRFTTIPLLFAVLFLCPILLQAQTARIENLTKIPGSNRGFPAEDYFTFHRSESVKNSKGEILEYTDRSLMRIHNDGSSTLVIDKLTTTNTDNFIIGAPAIPSGGLQVAAGRSVDVRIDFVTDSGESRRLITESLVMESNAKNASNVSATFRGAYMTSVEGNSEIDVQKVMTAYGFRTKMGVDNNGNLQVRPSSDFPSDSRVNSGREGDLILGQLFEQVDPNKPVQMVKMSAFHGPGGAPVELRDARSRGVLSGMRYSHDRTNHQTLLPRMEDTPSGPAGDFTSRIGEPFQIMIAGYRSTGGTREDTRKDELLAVRTYKVIDRNGRVVPNEYIVIQDYVGNGCGAGSNNCDWNDNVEYITNVRPVAKPTVKSIGDLTAAVGQSRTYNLSGSFSLGYAGNRLTFSVRSDGSGSLPSWLDIGSSTGILTATSVPGSAAGKTYALEVIATDLNGIKVSTTLDLHIDGDATPPPPPPSPSPTDPTKTTFWLEAECAEVGASWTTESSSSASEGKYVVVKRLNAMSSPPSDVPANRLRFSFDAKAGSYSLSARIDAPNNLDDSYYVRLNGGSWYKWNSGMEQGTGFTWNVYPGGNLQLREGSNTLDFAYREDGTRLDKIYLSTDPTQPSGTGSAASNCDGGGSTPGDDTVVEAECGDSGSGWEQGSDSGASAGKYLAFTGDRQMDVPSGDISSEQIRFDVSLAQEGDYSLFLRVDAPDPGRNSVWVKIDNGAWIKFWEEIGGDQLLTKGFEWHRVNTDGRAVTFQLAAGSHTIRIANREPGTLIDKLYLTTDTSPPTGAGPVAPACNSGATARRIDLAGSLEAEAPSSAPATLRVYPNPTDHLLNVVLESDFDGRVEMVVTDMTGRTVNRKMYDKQAGLLRTDLQVSALPGGVYYLRITEGDRHSVRPFVKR